MENQFKLGLRGESKKFGDGVNGIEGVGSERLLIYVSQGFDQTPASFYLADAADRADETAAETEGSSHVLDVATPRGRHADSYT